jgi:hypothetical protein
MTGIVVRAFEAGDKSFIYDSWLKSFRNTSPFAKSIRDDVYYLGEASKITAMSMRPKSNVMIATFPDEPGVILGFIAFEPETIHYCYVRDVWRKNGIARMLFEASGLSRMSAFTHWTDPCASFVARKDMELKYDPYRF